MNLRRRKEIIKMKDLSFILSSDGIKRWKSQYNSVDSDAVRSSKTYKKAKEAKDNGHMEGKSQDNKKFKCYFCKKSYNRLYDLYLHQQLTHSKTEYPFRCQCCNRRIRSFNGLCQHEWHIHGHYIKEYFTMYLNRVNFSYKCYF